LGASHGERQRAGCLPHVWRTGKAIAAIESTSSATAGAGSIAAGTASLSAPARFDFMRWPLQDHHRNARRQIHLRAVTSYLSLLCAVPASHARTRPASTRVGHELIAALKMHFPPAWDPYFWDTMNVFDVYHYGTQHFERHRRQLTLREIHLSTE
jgi:hypothetical protein